MKTAIITIGDQEEEEVKLFVKKADGDINGLKEYIEKEVFRKRKVTGYKEKEIVYLDYAEILYIDSMNGKQTIHSIQGEFFTPKRMYELEDMLGLPMFRISKSVIVNLEKVKCYVPCANGVMEARLLGGDSVYISRRYLKAVMERVRGERV